MWSYIVISRTSMFSYSFLVIVGTRPTLAQNNFLFKQVWQTAG